MHVDIEALKASRHESWKRLHERSGQRQYTGEEIDELAALYHQGTADLATIRSTNPDPDLIRLLSRDLAAARARLSGKASSSFLAVSRWFRLLLPAALYRLRWWTFGVMVIFCAVAAGHAWWILRDPSLFQFIGSPESLSHYAHHEFVAYYSQDTHAEFGTSVWVNNSFVALKTIAGGLTGFYPVHVLNENASKLGRAAAIVIHYAGAGHFFRFILPHGIPELTAVWLAAAAGLKTLWALIVPGSLTRAQSVAREGRAMITVALGTVILLLLSVMIEGFVTPSELPVWIKISRGVLVTSGVWVYTLWVGRRAANAGYTGDVEEDAGYSRPVSA